MKENTIPRKQCVNSFEDEILRFWMKVIRKRQEKLNIMRIAKICSRENYRGTTRSELAPGENTCILRKREEVI